MNKRDFIRDQLPEFLSNPLNTGAPIGTRDPIIFPANADYSNYFQQGGCFLGNYTYIYYVPDKISYASILPGCDIAISNLFSGCAMAYFNHSRNWYVAHISLGNPNDCGAEWNAFILAEYTNIRQYAIFKPYGEKRRAEKIIQSSNRRDLKYSAVGIITRDLRCYTAVTTLNYNPIEIIERKKHIHVSNNLSVESFLPNFLIPDNRTNW